MWRDLWIGGALGIGLYGWRTQTQRVALIVKQTQSQTQQLQQQLDKAQQELAIALAQRTALETQVAELNQLATDRAIELIQLQADNAELSSQVAELSPKRTRKKRAAKVTVPEAFSDPVPLCALEHPEPPSFSLNLELVQAKQIESAAATQLLQSVFIEDPSAAASPQASLELDTAHTAFLQILKRQITWSREELVQIAQQLDLLLDGALELLNEAAFDRCDEALTEGEDPLEVNLTVLQELLS